MAQKAAKQEINQFNARESCTVLAALRYWQRTVENPAEASPDHFEDADPLNDEEIDDLCERITLDWTKCSSPVVKAPKKKLCTDVRCELPADHTGPCKGEDDDEEDEDDEDGLLECPHGHSVCPIC